MPLVSFHRCVPSLMHVPSLMQLEDRCTPALITVNNLAWNKLTEGSLPWAVEQANLAPGQDTITFDWTALGNKPKFTALDTRDVKEGVVIQAGGGSVYATIAGTRAFNFSHDKPGAAGDGLVSVFRGGVFDGCIVGVIPGQLGIADAGGAVQVTGGTLKTINTRFMNNIASSGGAIVVDGEGKLVLDGDPTLAPPDPADGKPAIPEHQAPRTLFLTNSVGSNGGSLWVRGEVELRRVWFVDNAAKDGGAVVVTHQGKLTAEPWMVGETTVDPDVQFLRNKATVDGGAIFYRSGRNSSSLTKITVIGNTAIGRGGGIAVLKGTLSLTDSLVSANAAGVGLTAGGIHIEGATHIAKVVATRVKFDNNDGHMGRAVMVLSWGELNTHGCDFSNNNLAWTSRTPAAPGEPLNPLGVHNTDPNDPNVNYPPP